MSGYKMHLDMREDRSETFTHGKIVETSRHGYEDLDIMIHGTDGVRIRLL